MKKSLVSRVYTVLDFSTGRQFEQDILGDADFPNEIANTPRHPFEESLVLAEAHAATQLRDGFWNPASPSTRPSLQLLEHINRAFSRLNARTPLRTVEVELVNTLGTPLDIIWGVDAYLRIPATEPLVIVKIDVTTNWQKIRAGPPKKVDFYLTPADIVDEAAIKVFAGKVARLLRKRLYAQQKHCANA